MKTTLNVQGQIGIPQQILEADHLVAGDSFELERLTSGHYLLAKQQPHETRFTIATGEDGLPVIRNTDGIITSQLVKEIESQIP
jgi:bifunctional DNA-binding transcriptional regulator/antitoxin component of YhaV-PrlF toxin-antitoxin module